MYGEVITVWGLFRCIYWKPANQFYRLDDWFKIWCPISL